MVNKRTYKIKVVAINQKQQTQNDDEIELLYTSEQLGTSSLAAHINTLWLNNILQYVMRDGGSEHRQLCWADITFCFESDLGSASQYFIYCRNIIYIHIIINKYLL
jgi:hypothetical protein